MMRYGLAHFALVALSSEVAPAVPLPPADAPHALSLTVEQQDGRVAIALSGLAAQTTQVSYLLEVTGTSNSRHRGKTTLAANVPARLSTMTVDAGKGWCVRLLAEEEGRDPYEIREGHCPEGS
ncbi:MAG: hypothetical protein GW858_06710 [Sphingomonadales bacterium]|nr:hypothetical protein [Sphingomonadales bacterium]NCQ21156.1 hypothetical protein [Sphingomonadales bacterium]NCT03929.1 hypothetical protein [Sphingomonadales bacterium]